MTPTKQVTKVAHQTQRGRRAETRIRLSLSEQDLTYVVEHLPESPVQLRLKAKLLEAAK